MTDTRDTGEHFLGPLTDEPDISAQISARRVADLTTQIDFLDREIARYRELVEQERIRHSTEIANLQLEADTRFDGLRREERLQTTELHDSYRVLLSDRQVEFEQSLSDAAAASAAELINERRRHHETLERERSRRDTMLNAARKQTLEEANESHERERHALGADLARAVAAIDRLQAELEAQIERADHAETRATEAQARLSALERNIDRSDSRHRLRVDEAEKQLANAISRLESERQRSAATLSELLERSASIAAEADKARSDFAAQHAKAEHAAAWAHQRATDEYQALAEAADDRASRAIQRESELEAAIAELRDLLPPASH